MSRPRLSAQGIRSWARARIALLVVLAVAVSYMTIVTLQHTRAVSPIDEWVYQDYLQKLPAQGIVYEGETMSQESLRLMACVGTSPYGPIGPPCADSYSDDQLAEFPQQGLTTASPYTPLYFTATWVVGTPLGVVSGLGDVAGWRLTGVLWLAATIIAMFALFRRFGVRDLPAIAVTLAFVASPYSWWTYSYVSTDAPAVLVGVLLLILAVDLARGRKRGVALVVVGVVATLVKLTNVIGLGLALLYLIAVLVRRVVIPADRPLHGTLRRDALRLLAPPLLSIALGVALQGVWLSLVRRWAVSDVGADQGIGYPLTPEELLLQVTNFLPQTIVSSPISAYVPGFVYTPLSWLCVVGVIGSLFLLRRFDELPVATTLATLLAAPVLAIALQLVTGSYFQLPARYGGPLLAGTLTLAALILRNRAAEIAVLAYGAALIPVGIWLSAYLATLA